jgi:hypothetical protein
VEVAVERGYEVRRNVVPRDAIEDALRHIHLDVLRNGLSAEAMGKWVWSGHWFPHLKWDAPILALEEQLPAELRDGQLCDPQILLHPPDDCDDLPLRSHVDEEPEWANGRRYRRIVGVPLTSAHAENGGLVVWPFGAEDREALDVEPGDLVVMHPALPHTSGLNREGAIRYAIYFRYLEPEPAA